MRLEVEHPGAGTLTQEVHLMALPLCLVHWIALFEATLLEGVVGRLAFEPVGEDADQEASLESRVRD